MAIVIKSKKHKRRDKDVSSDKKERKKRKKKKDLLPVPISKKEQKLLQRNLTRTNKALSLFGQSSVNIQELLIARDNDNAIDAANRAMLQFLLDLIPIAESRYREDSRQSNAYALGHLVDQARSLISDIQAAGDRSVITDKIVYDIMKPTMMTLAQFLIDSNYQLKRELTDYISPDKQKQAHTSIDNSTKAAGTYVQAMFNDLKERVTKALGEG